LKHFPISVFSQLVLFNAIFWIQYFRQLGKHARVFHPENRKGLGAALVLSTHKSARHDWQAVWKDLTRFLCEAGGVSYYTMSRVGSDPSTALRYSTPVSWKECPGTLARRGQEAGFPRCDQCLRYCMSWRSPLQTISP
jgi:hypothetical protein